MQACFSGPLNTRAFETRLQSHTLPRSDDITYSGAFNELTFEAGPKAIEPLQLHIGYCRSQNSESAFDRDVHDYLAIFTKGRKDGQDRDSRPLNAVICLDISGSMGGSLSSKCNMQRIQLAKEAIKMFVSKLRPTDNFALVTFDTKATANVGLGRVGEPERAHIFQIIDQIQDRGGTNLRCGIDCAAQLLTEQTVSDASENRIVMITDVQDNSFANEKPTFEALAKRGIHATIVGVSEEFRSDLCENLIDVKGFNYFCATEIGDLRRYLFENFSFTFFPSSHDTLIRIEGAQIASFEVFGSSDASKVLEYNEGFTGKGPFTITRTKTSFPSELQVDMVGNVKMYGGLLLIKLKLREPSSKFEAKVLLQYRAVEEGGEVVGAKEYPISFEGPLHEQFFTQESLRQAVAAYHYVFEAKSIIDAVNKNPKAERKTYIQSLKALARDVPSSKAKELEKLIKVLSLNI